MICNKSATSWAHLAIGPMTSRELTKGMVPAILINPVLYYATSLRHISLFWYFTRGHIDEYPHVGLRANKPYGRLYYVSRYLIALTISLRPTAASAGAHSDPKVSVPNAAWANPAETATALPVLLPECEPCVGSLAHCVSDQK